MFIIWYHGLRFSKTHLTEAEDGVEVKITALQHRIRRYNSMHAVSAASTCTSKVDRIFWAFAVASLPKNTTFSAT
jgi:hypothetical protein